MTSGFMVIHAAQCAARLAPAVAALCRCDVADDGFPGGVPRMATMRFGRHHTPAHLIARRCLCMLVIALSAACQGGDAGTPASRAKGAQSIGTNAELRIETIATLNDLGEPIIGRHGRISVDRLGRFIIADHSDASIKIYSADGRRVDTFGRRGRGPGEFQFLMDAGVVGDRIFGYDAMNRLAYFAEDGTVTETVPLHQGEHAQPAPYSITALDENRLLFATFPEKGANLLRITAMDGTTINEFFPLDAEWTQPPSLWQDIFLPNHIWHQADAFGGLIFSGMWGGETLHVFDYDGTLLGSGPADAIEPLISFRELLERSNGRILDADGISIRHGNRVIRRVVATEGSTVTVHVAPTVTGADPLEGGTLIVLRWDDGELSEIGRLQSEWGLLGRDADGHALVMRYATQDTYDLGRVVWSDSPAR